MNLRYGVLRRLLGSGRAALQRAGRPSDAGVERAVRWLTLFAAAVANLVGTVSVFVLSVWVLPTDEVQANDAPILVNLALATAYVAVAIPVGMAWALRRLRPGRAWLKDGREPTVAEQRNLLRAPLHVLFVVGSLWLLAALAFGLYNSTYSLELGYRVGLTVALGGLVTCSVAYLLSERLLRPAAARALAARRLDEPALPGVTGRAMFAWGLGSGIPLLGLILVGLSTLTEQDFTRDELAIAVLGLAGGSFVLGFAAMLFAARITADPIVSLKKAVAGIEDGDFETEVPVYDGTEVGLLQSGFNRMAEGLREREEIRELFGMHVGVDVARAAMERGSGLGGEARELAVLFVDLIASTEIASRRPAHEVVELLNDFFGIVVAVVDQSGGWVNKFEGDAALAIFGAPEPLEDAAGDALAAGRELARRLHEEISEARAGIGVSYGTAVAGNIGSEHRLEYTVIGDAVNEAARLTELAKDHPGMLVASQAAVDGAREEEARRWELGEEVELRGRSERTRLATPAD